MVVSALVFALLHGTQNLPLFLDRLGFGLLAAVLVWRTGGWRPASPRTSSTTCSRTSLAGLTTSIAEIRAISEIGWVDAAFDVGGFALFAVLAYLRRSADGLRPGPSPVASWDAKELGPAAEGVKSLLVPASDRRVRHGGVWGNWQPG